MCAMSINNAAPTVCTTQKEAHTYIPKYNLPRFEDVKRKVTRLGSGGVVDLVGNIHSYQATLITLVMAWDEKCKARRNDEVTRLLAP